MARKTTRKIVMSADRYAHPTMGDLAKDAAEFVAPRTVGDGLTVANVFGDIGELTPFAGAVPYVERELGLKDYSDEDIMLAAILGFPILNKVAGKPVLNAKHALGPRGWSSLKHGLTHGTRKLHATPPITRAQSLNADEVLSTRGRIGATQEAIDAPTTSTVFGPFDKGGTNSGIRSQGQQEYGTNTVKTKGSQNKNNKPDGSRGYTGNDMYSPLRKPNDNITYGPWRTEASKADRPLRDNMNKLEDQWQYYIDVANGPKTSKQKTQDMIMAAENMGRPDIADKILLGERSGRNNVNYKPYTSYSTTVNKQGSITDWMNYNNRQVEKHIREQFSMIPDNLKPEFAQRYGTYDLLNDWQQNPAKWDAIRTETERTRRHRMGTILNNDKKYGRNIKR